MAATGTQAVSAEIKPVYPKPKKTKSKRRPVRPSSKG